MNENRSFWDFSSISVGTVFRLRNGNLFKCFGNEWLEFKKAADYRRIIKTIKWSDYWDYYYFNY